MMQRFKIERENKSLGEPGLNAKHKWIHICCAKNNDGIEHKLLDYVSKSKSKLRELENTKIRIIDRSTNSEVIEKFSNIHNKIDIKNIFELFRNHLLTKTQITISWYRGRVLDYHAYGINQESYKKATTHGANTFVVEFYTINPAIQTMMNVTGVLTSDEVPEFVKENAVVNHYSYKETYAWLKDKEIYILENIITNIVNKDDDYKIELWSDWR